MPPPPPPAPGSPVLIPTSFRQPIVSFSNITYTGPDFSDEETTRPDSADAKGNTDNSSLRLQDWDYGERSGIQPNQVDIRMLVLRKHLEPASSYFEKMF